MFRFFFFFPFIRRCFVPLRAADAHFSLGSFLALLNELESLGSPTQLSQCLLTEQRKISESCKSPFAQEGLEYIRLLRIARPKPFLGGMKNFFKIAFSSSKVFSKLPYYLFCHTENVSDQSWLFQVILLLQRWLSTMKAFTKQKEVLSIWKDCPI